VGRFSLTAYTQACCVLAKRLREMFDKELVEKCVGLNAIFFRANSVEDYKRQWDTALCATIEDFVAHALRQW
jgi:hypothetical protein